MPLPDLSRECIRDTLMYKRDPAQWKDHRFRALYKASIQRLRSGQLAPHNEKMMLPGRFLKMQTEKRAAAEVIIVVRCGHVHEVLSTNPYTNVLIADYSDDDMERELDEAEERAAQPDMQNVYRRF